MRLIKTILIVMAATISTIACNSELAHHRREHLRYGSDTSSPRTRIPTASAAIRRLNRHLRRIPNFNIDRKLAEDRNIR